MSIDTADSGDSTPRDLRNARYCEVIPVTQDGIWLTSRVFNTLGLNDCPECEWAALTEEQVNEEYGSVAAKLNGPRFWVINQLLASGSSVDAEQFTFGGIEMEKRATLTTRLREGTVGEEFYTPNEVQRQTVYTYNAGAEVYELTSPAPERDVYVMQSYAQIADTTLTIDDLPTLGGRLAMPDGWTYAPRTLAEDLVLDSGGLAYVINDDLYNSYQRRT
jgi:hypothetical protein